MTTLEQRLDAGDIIILDGAIGTELQLRGAPMDGMAWCAVATKTSPGILRGLHEDYIRAGAAATRCRWRRRGSGTPAASRSAP